MKQEQRKWNDVIKRGKTESGILTQTYMERKPIGMNPEQRKVNANTVQGE